MKTTTIFATVILLSMVILLNLSFTIAAEQTFANTSLNPATGQNNAYFINYNAGVMGQTFAMAGSGCTDYVPSKLMFKTKRVSCTDSNLRSVLVVVTGVTA